MQHQLVACLVANLQCIAHADVRVHQRRYAAQAFHGLPWRPVLQVHRHAILACALDGVAFSQVQPGVATRIKAHRTIHTRAVIQGAHQAAPAQHVQRVGMGDEGAHIVVRRVQHDLFRHAVLDDLAVFHDRDTAAELECFIQVVADEHDGLAQFALQFQ